jgi:hypothetical protein
LVHQLEGDEDHNPLDPSSLPALSSPLQIRPYGAADWPAVWALLALSSDIRFWSSGDTKTGPPVGLLMGA